MIRELAEIRAYITRMNETMGKEDRHEDSRLRYKADAALGWIERELGTVITNAEVNVYAAAKAIVEAEAQKEQKL